MVQLVVAPELAEGNEFRPKGDDLHYLLHVRRTREDDHLVLLDGTGRRWDTVVTRVAASEIVLRVQAPVDDAAAEPEITVYQAIPKGRRFDEAIRSLVQAGATRIVPLITERTIVDPSGKDDKQNRWRRVAREAVQQSGATALVHIDPPTRLTDLPIDSETLTLFLHTLPIADATLHGYLGSAPEAFGFVVGPEGGFSPKEVEWLLARDAYPVWLGPRVLRSENAGFFAVAAARTILLERGVWQKQE